MVKKRRILLASLAVVALALLGWLGVLWWNDKPSGNRLFHGKPESAWIQDLKYRDEDQVKVWRGFGDDGVQVLLRALRRANHPGQRAYRKLWPHLPSFAKRFWPSPPEDSTKPVRATVTELLSRLGYDAKSAEPAMARALEDESYSVRQLALNYFTCNEDENAPLNKIDKKEKQRLLPHFIRAMQDSEWSVRNNTLVALRYYPEEAQRVVPVLKNALQDPDERVRRLATNYLKQIDPAAAAKAGLK